MNQNKVLHVSTPKAIARPVTCLKTFCKWTWSLIVGTCILITASPVLAHHPSGGKTPSTFIAGFLSGLGHPVIGIDHLAFAIAIGLLAAFVSRLGMIIPVAFTVATAVGTGIHLQGVDLPVPELIISASVLIAGVFLARARETNLILSATIVAIAGIFHGYAYGESIVGAQMTALGAYLLGFGIIQLGISAAAYYLGRLILNEASIPLRFIGLVISGIGIAFVSRAILG